MGTEEGNNPSGDVKIREMMVRDVGRPLWLLLAGSIVAGAATLITLFGGAAKSWVETRILGAPAEAVAHGDSGDFALPPIPMWITIPFQNTGPCLKFVKEWAKSERVVARDAGGGSIVLTEENPDGSIVTQRVTCAVPTGSESSVAIFTPPARSEETTAANEDDFISRFQQWLNEKLDGGKYFSQSEDNWNEILTSQNIFLSTFDQTDKDTVIDIKYGIFPKKIIEALKKTPFNHFNCGSKICVVSAPGAQIYLYATQHSSLTEHEKSRLKSAFNLDASGKGILIGMSNSRVYSNYDALDFSDAEIERIISSIPGLTYVGSFNSSTSD